MPLLYALCLLLLNFHTVVSDLQDWISHTRQRMRSDLFCVLQHIIYQAGLTMPCTVHKNCILLSGMLSSSQFPLFVIAPLYRLFFHKHNQRTTRLIHNSNWAKDQVIHIPKLACSKSNRLPARPCRRFRVTLTNGLLRCLRSPVEFTTSRPFCGIETTELIY